MAAARQRRGWATLGAGCAAVGLAATGMAGCGSSSPGPGVTVSGFVAALSHKDYAAAASLVDAPPADLAATYQAAATDLGVTAASYQAGAPVTKGSTATAPLTWHVTIGAYGPLDIHSTVNLHKLGGRWKVVWGPATVADQLGAGDHFSVTRTWPARAPVLGANGASLTPAGVTVGLVGQRIKDPAQLTSIMVAAGFPAGAVASAVHDAQANPTQLVPVGTIPESTYQSLKTAAAPNLYSVGGTSFTGGAQTPLTPDLGTHLLGVVGPITAAQLKTLGAPYSATSRVGQNGIEAVYERTLAGTPAVTVAVRDAKGTTVATLARKAATPGTPVTTSVDPAVQQAAEAAMDGVAPTVQAAMVVLRASTGQILASVSRPTATPFDVALDARVPPGSTFKVVTSTALLQHGDTPSTPATCPQTITVNGQSFHNFEGEAAPNLDLATAFAVSCNTAFIGLTRSLPPAALPQAGALFGLGTTPKPGLGVAGTSVPTPTDANQLASTTIGQAGVVVSPLAMASMAATVDAGSYHPPRLVAGAPDDTAAATPLPAGVAAALRSLMAGVVTGNGTAAGAGLPAGTYGKTGTAEFGAGPNPPTHAWFVGFKGDIAFAVFVYGGGVGGVVAAPLAAKLLSALPAGA
ncbi:hypothetical protein K6U06_20920 [Acidiferrimicrobium sp. IK]|uniref:penicillin-binding transpeptidase domain-containing protein n=1 Tax=Acidiferrimicrobium sp. IK TaxID=2871700 RepID=UPI0021CB2DD1|nr:penicillin-binding transpeptidase domain-containing protein [Acidiferrimicrobium sp. IK]MCU4186841.1 hypothetical protein [Acidiferrimicrobium sp. IK]